eukprot:3583055-Prymnesium_polylepis.1
MHREGYGEVFAQAAAVRGWECVPAGPEYCGPLAGGGGHCSLLLLTAASRGHGGGATEGRLRPGALSAPRVATTGEPKPNVASRAVVLTVTPDGFGGVTTALQFSEAAGGVDPPAEHVHLAES